MNIRRVSRFSCRLIGIVVMLSMVFLNLSPLGDVIVAHAQEPTPFAPPPAQVQSITLLDPNPTNAASVNFSVVFTKAVINVDAADFSLTTTGEITGASVSATSGQGDTYTVMVNTGMGSGTIRLDVPASATITDNKGTPIDGLPYTAGEVYEVDKSAPTVSITSTASDPTNANPIPVTITFSEDVTGFVIEDITAGNGTTSNFAGSGAAYTVDITPAADGVITIDVDAAAAQDAAGNDNTAASQFSITYDSTAPTVDSITRADPSPTNAASVDFSLTFSEAVTGVDTADFSLTTTGAVTGASVTAVSGSGDTYTVTVDTGSGDGTIRLDVNASGTGIEDLDSNPLDGGFTSGETYTLQRSPVFTDVPLTHWAVSYIENIYFHGITTGCGPDIYCPSDPVTRAQMAVFLLRSMHGSEYIPPPASGTVFADVSLSHWAASWIEQLAAEGITSGCGGGNYCPNDSVTRAQMAVFLLRAEHGSSYLPPPAAGIFNDVPLTYWAVTWIEQLAAEGITSGCGGGNYCPSNPVTRAQMAVFLVKTFNMVWP